MSADNPPPLIFVYCRNLRALEQFSGKQDGELARQYKCRDASFFVACKKPDEYRIFGCRNNTVIQQLLTGVHFNVESGRELTEIAYVSIDEELVEFFIERSHHVYETLPRAGFAVFLISVGGSNSGQNFID
jgi:hypothetical protein